VEKYVICHLSLTEKILPLVVKQIPISSTNLTIKIYSGEVLMSNAFGILKNLKSLSINGDKLRSFQEVNKDSFTGLTELTFLSIAHSNITTLPKECFAPLTNLEKLSLSHNRLDNVADGLLKAPPTIQYLDLSWNAFKIFPYVLVKKMPNLAFLDIGHNAIDVLNLDFSASAKLGELRMSSTGVTSLQDNTFNGLGNLRTLLLKHNLKLKIVSTIAFAPLKNLESLTIENGLLQMKAGHFKSLTKLKILSLIDAFKMQKFPPKFFEGLNSLETLNLRSCGLREVEDFDFRPFVSSTLKNLDLSYNNLPVIQNNTFYGCKNLEVLNLAHKLASKDNKPRVFQHCAFTGLSALKLLDISSNNLEIIQKNFDVVLGMVKSADIVALKNNVTCNCGILPFSNWVQETNASLEMLCHQPLNVKDIQINSLNSTFLKCNRKPVFDYKLNVTTKPINIGKNITYECSAYAYHGYPNVTYNVTKGNPFPSNDTNIIESKKIGTDGMYRMYLKFEFESYQKEYIGTITCTASNDYGNSHMMIDVTYESSGGLAIWAIVIIVIVVVVVVAGAAALMWWLYQRSINETSLLNTSVSVDSTLTRTYV
jgi:Leucine-rich repeat (LRR) protein